MILLIEYNRRKGKLADFCSFEDSQRREAEVLRLERELELNRKRIEHEVVLLEAASEADIRRTHRRYFEDLREILETPIG